MKAQTIKLTTAKISFRDPDMVRMNKAFFPSSVHYISGFINKLFRINKIWGYRATMQLLAFGIRPRISNASRAFYNQGRCTNIRSGQKKFKIYSYGSGPAILLIHGFASNGSRWKTLVPQLVNQGHEVIVMDAPAHGTSAGYFMSVPQFIQATKKVLTLKEEWHAVIAHSMGSLAGSVAATELTGLVQIRRLILMCTFATGNQLMSKFARCLGISEEVLEGTRRWMPVYTGHPLSYYNLNQHLDKLQLPTLLIYDQSDIVVPKREAILLTQQVPSIATMTTQHLGHQLKSPVVDQRILKFMKDG